MDEKKPDGGSIALTHTESETVCRNIKNVSIITKYWRGAFSLSFSFWVVFILLSAVVYFLQLWISHSVSAYYMSIDIDTRFVSALEIARVWVGFSIVAIYIFVSFIGVWRSAGHIILQTHKRTLPYLTRTVAVLVASFFIIVCVMVMKNKYSVMKEITKPQDNLYTLSISVNNVFGNKRISDKILHITGVLAYGIANDVRKSIRENPDIRVVQLKSRGGNDMMSRDLARIFAKEGINTFVTDHCNSSCTTAFLGGKRRVLTPEGKLGFHLGEFIPEEGQEQYFSFNRSKKKHSIANKKADEIYFKYLNKHHVPDWFLKRLSNVSFEQVWFPTNEELMSANIVTDISSSPIY